MKKFILLLISILMLSPLLSGCDYKDINRRAFIVEMGIDSVKTDEIIGVSYKIAIPSGGGESGGGRQKDFATYYIESASIGGSIRMLQSMLSLEPDFAQLKVLVVGRKFAENYPVHSIVDYFLRRRDIQNIAYCIVGDPNAKTVVFSTSKDSNVPGSELFLKFGQGTESPYARGTRLFEFYRSTKTHGETPYCPVASVEDGEIVVNRLGAFSRDFKMKYILSPKETETFNILTDNIKSTFIQLQTPSHKPFGAHLVTVHSKPKFITKNDGTIICNIKIVGSAMLEETPTSFQDITALEEVFSNRLSEDAARLIQTLQSKNLDPMLLEKSYWASNSSFNLTDEWPAKIFPNIKFNIETEIKISTTGTLQ